MTPFLLAAAGLFVAGVLCLLMQRNAVALLLGVELILNAAVLNFLTFAAFSESFAVEGQVFALVVAALAALEAVVGLAIVKTYQAQRGSVDVDAARELRG